jgi:hypothetical protein
MFQQFGLAACLATSAALLALAAVVSIALPRQGHDLKTSA